MIAFEHFETPKGMYDNLKYIINNIRVALDDRVTNKNEIDLLKKLAAKKLQINSSEIEKIKIVKESIDARRKSKIDLVYSVTIETEKSKTFATDSDIRVLDEDVNEDPNSGEKPINNRPVVVGSGPAGLFAGLFLAQNGYKPLIIERGRCVEERTKIVEEYWKSGKLDVETNVQFGEGGAGTFSDGKLTTRINDYRCEKVLEELHKAGAPEEILYKSKPHIGTDILRNVVKNLRRKIISLGGEFRFQAKLTSIKLNQGKMVGVVINNNEVIPTDVMVLAIGHSARDTFTSLLSDGLDFVQKPFSIGVRIEHPQEMINISQYGKFAGHPKLGAADYQLFCKLGGRTVYSFCMCPGGTVVASASEKNSIVTNGMSEFSRDKQNANSALVVSVEPNDFGTKHPLAGIEFQRTFEHLAYEIAGNNGSAPVQRLEDFVLGINSLKLGNTKSSYTGSTSICDLNQCLPSFVTNPMKESIGYFDNKLKGFGMKDAVLTGVETRTSSPIRIPRNDSLESPCIDGLFPAGEGAGYAGGIVSAAVDGIKVAEQVMKKYARPV